jgi:hypothetical protein
MGNVFWYSSKYTWQWSKSNDNSPNRKQYPILSKLQFECTNNMVDYKACILGL